MPLPFLLGGVAVLATAIGASSHKDARETNEKAERVSRKAKALYEESKESLEKAQKNTEQLLLKLGYEKKSVLDGSMKQFVEVYDRIKNIQMKESDGLKEISCFSIEQQDVMEIKRLSDIYSNSIQSGAAGVATGAVIALAASGTLPIVTGTLSLAGTVLSWGSVGAAASMAGMAISTAVTATPLAAVVAPAVFFTGVSASMKADENLEKAEEMYAEAEKASEEMKVSETLCKAIGERSEMFYGLLLKLNGMFGECTDMLESTIKEKEQQIGAREIVADDLTENEIALVAVTRALAGAVKTVIDTPILGKDGKVSKESLEIYNNSGKSLPDFSRTVHELKEIQGNNDALEYDDVMLWDAKDIEKNEIRRMHEELKHKLEMKREKDSLLYAKNRDKFCVAPEYMCPVNAKTAEMIEEACNNFISDQKQMKLYHGDAGEVKELRGYFDPNSPNPMYLIYDDSPSEHGWNGFAINNSTIYCRSASEKKVNQAYFRRLVEADNIYFLDGCIYADAELIGVCTGTDYEQEQMKDFFIEVISIVRENL